MGVIELDPYSIFIVQDYVHSVHNTMYATFFRFPSYHRQKYNL